MSKTSSNNNLLTAGGGSGSGSNNNLAASSAAASSRRVFKKQSYDEQLTLYIPSRDFIDNGNTVDVVDAVVLVDDIVHKNKEKKVFLKVSACFRYGNNDWDVLGVGFEKALFEETVKVFPPPEKYTKITKFQERMCKKLGKNSFPATIIVPTKLPNSVQLLSIAQEKKEKGADSCGIFYDVIAYVAKDEAEAPNKKHAARFAIKKVAHTPPSAEGVSISKIVIEKKDPNVEISLNKHLFYHNEPVEVNLNILNNTSREVKSIEIRLIQTVTLQMAEAPKSWKYKNKLTFLESTADCPIQKGTSYKRVFSLLPIIPNQQDKKEVRQVAIDSNETGEDNIKLAGTTVVSNTPNDANAGLVVGYYIHVTLHRTMGNIKAKIPFTLSHAERPKPIKTPSTPSTNRKETNKSASSTTAEDSTLKPPAAANGVNSTEYISGTEFDDVGDWGGEEDDSRLSEEFSKFIADRARAYDS